MAFLFWLCVVLFILVSLILMLLVLIQKGRGGGLASAFGGGGGNTAFGSKTGDVLTWATSVVFGVFLLLGVVLNLLANHRHTSRLTALGVTPVATPAAPQLPGTTPEPTAGDTTASEDVKTQPQLPPGTGLPPAVSGDNRPAGESAPAAAPAEVSPAGGATPPPPATPVEAPAAAPPATQP